MPLIAGLKNWASLEILTAADLNGNFSEIATKLNAYGAWKDQANTFTALQTFANGVAITGDIAITGNGSFTGTLTSGGALTVSAGGATIVGNVAITGNQSLSGTLTVAALSGAYTVPFSKLTAGENGVGGTYGLGIRNFDTARLNVWARTEIGDEGCGTNKTLRLGSETIRNAVFSGSPAYSIVPWEYTNWDITLNSGFGSGIFLSTPSDLGAPVDQFFGMAIKHGWFVSLVVRQDATGGRTWSLTGAVDFPNGSTQPTWDLSANKVYHIFLYLRDNRWKVLAWHG